jgi:hypothetical protein
VPELPSTATGSPQCGQATWVRGVELAGEHERHRRRRGLGGLLAAGVAKRAQLAPDGGRDLHQDLEERTGRARCADVARLQASCSGPV